MAYGRGPIFRGDFKCIG